MKRVLFCLVLAVTLTSLSGAILRGQPNFSRVTYLKASNPGLDDHLGFGSALMGRTLALSRDGNTLAVSASEEDSAATGIKGNQKDDSASDAGAVYVFTRAGAMWSQQAYLKAPNSDAYDEFGGEVAVSGDANTLAVTARGEDGGSAGVNGNQADNSVRSSGAVYVY